MNRCLKMIAVFLLLPGVFAGRVRGQDLRDKVTLLNEEDGSRVRLMCTVVDHTGEFIRYRLRDDGPVTVKPSAQVVSIETSQSRTHIEALEKYAEGDIQAAEQLFEKALTQDPREWVRRDILAMLVRCALRQENSTRAGERFLMIYGSDRTTHHMRGIPLVWTTKAPGPQLKNAALGWLERGSPAAVLLGGSALLFDPKYQAEARLELQQLWANPDPRIRYLAIAQLWRLELPDGQVEGPMLGGWQDTIRSMPADVRGGPYFLLGEGLSRRRQFDRAAVAYLWVPLVYDYDYQLSALASLNAGDALKAVGRRDEAISLYREIVTRYGQTSYAQDAAQALESLKPDSPANPASHSP